MSTRARGGRSKKVGRTALGLLEVGALALGVVGLAGCPEPPDPPYACAPDGSAPVLTLANRGGGSELADGVEVEVFPPPQGGVFTELDVRIEGLALRELDFLQITVDAIDSGESLAFVRYFGDAIPLRCTESEALTVDYLPVGFGDLIQLPALEGVQARLTGRLETTRGDFETHYDVVLRATEY